MGGGGRQKKGVEEKGREQEGWGEERERAYLKEKGEMDGYVQG